MAHSFLICDFGGNEELAQQARHKIDGWKQGYRLDKKLQVKFERKEKDQDAQPVETTASASKSAKSGAKEKAKPGAKSKSKSRSEEEPSSKTEPTAANHTDIRLIVRLDFSDHEKLSHQRWIERIPTEEPFKASNPKIVRAGEPEFKATSDLFDLLD
jgi:hypothetical protein